MFLNYNQDQTFLLPPSFREFLGDSHEAVILSEIIDELNLDTLIQEYHQEWKWRPAFHPRMLLKVLFYWYMNQTFSSRKLASKLISDLWFMFIAWNNQPDFRTINRFRKEKWSILEEIFVQIVLKAKDLGIIQFWTVNLDGTKIYANASNEKNNEIKKIDAKIKSLFDEASKIDNIEDDLYWDNDGSNIPEQLKTKEWRDQRRKELEKIRNQLDLKKDIVNKEIAIKNDQGINQTRINLTDKDSRLMMMKRKDRWNWYNPQNLTENQFILTTTVPNSASDYEELIPILEKFYSKYNCFPKNQVADKWYASESNYRFLEDYDIASYIPHPNQQVDIDNYVYHKESDIFEDKQWNLYTLKQKIWKTTWWLQWKKLKSEDVKSKIYVSEITWIKKYIHVNLDRHNLAKRNDERLYSDSWKAIYKKRSWCVETVFWNIKANFWFEKFRLRWFKWVQIERNLISLAHNLKKLINFQLAS